MIHNMWKQLEETCRNIAPVIVVIGVVSAGFLYVVEVNGSILENKAAIEANRIAIKANRVAIEEVKKEVKIVRDMVDRNYQLLIEMNNKLTRLEAWVKQTDKNTEDIGNLNNKVNKISEDLAAVKAKVE